MKWPWDDVIQFLFSSEKPRDAQHGDGVCCAFAPQLVTFAVLWSSEKWYFLGVTLVCPVLRIKAALSLGVMKWGARPTHTIQRALNSGRRCLCFCPACIFPALLYSLYRICLRYLRAPNVVGRGVACFMPSFHCWFILTAPLLADPVCRLLLTPSCCLFWLCDHKTPSLCYPGVGWPVNCPCWVGISWHIVWFRADVHAWPISGNALNGCV